MGIRCDHRTKHWQVFDLDHNKLSYTAFVRDNFKLREDERGKGEHASYSQCVSRSLQLVPPHYKMSRWFLNLLASNSAMFTFFTFVLASNALLTDLLGPGTASAYNDEPFWMEGIKHQGISPFNPNATEYQVFRNVKVIYQGCKDYPCLCSTILSGLWRSW